MCVCEEAKPVLLFRVYKPVISASKSKPLKFQAQPGLLTFCMESSGDKISVESKGKGGGAQKSHQRGFLQLQLVEHKAEILT